MSQVFVRGLTGLVLVGGQSSGATGPSFAETLGVLGFVVSVALASIKTWETFFRKSRFVADIDWAETHGRPVLEVSVANTGWKKDSIRAIHFRSSFPKQPDPHEREWVIWEIRGPTWGEVPVVLDVDEVTPRLELSMNDLAKLGLDSLVDALLNGRAQLRVVNARGREALFDVPPPGDGPPPPMAADLSK